MNPPTTDPSYQSYLLKTLIGTKNTETTSSQTDSSSSLSNRDVESGSSESSRTDGTSHSHKTFNCKPLEEHSVLKSTPKILILLSSTLPVIPYLASRFSLSFPQLNDWPMLLLNTILTTAYFASILLLTSAAILKGFNYSVNPKMPIQTVAALLALATAATTGFQTFFY